MLATDLMRQVASYLSDMTAEQVQDSQRRIPQSQRPPGALQAHPGRLHQPLVRQRSRQKAGLRARAGISAQARRRSWLQDPDKVRLPSRDYMECAGSAETALKAAEEKRFFHWELEFPEVFFAPSTPGGQDVQLREDGGFDAVVGNPPYGWCAIEPGYLRDYLSATSE